MASLVRRFDEHPIHWAIGQADDLTPAGERVPYESALPYGILTAGQVNKWAGEQGANWPIHCAGLMMRTAAVRALGGWVASPADDDVAMFAALSEISDGYNEPSVTWLYRHHAEQTHRTEAWQRCSAAGRRIALQRSVAVGAAGLQLDAAQDRHVKEVDVQVGPPHPKWPYLGVRR